MQTGTDGAAEQNATKIDAWNIDYMTPILDWVVPANMSSCVHDEGLKMWFYTSCEPILPMPNLRLDNTLLDARSLFWLAAAMEVEGFLYWGFNAYAESVASFTPIDLSGGGSSELSRGSSSSSSSSSSGGGGRDSGGSINTTPPPPLFLPPTQWSLATCTVDGPGKCWAAGLEQIQGDGKLMYVPKHTVQLSRCLALSLILYLSVSLFVFVLSYFSPGLICHTPILLVRAC